MTNRHVQRIIDNWIASDSRSLHDLVKGAFSYQAKLAGKRKSKAKANASRLNGLKGGRPKL